MYTKDPNKELEEMSQQSTEQQSNIDEESLVSNTPVQERQSLQSVPSNSVHSEPQKQEPTPPNEQLQQIGDEELNENHSNVDNEEDTNNILEPGQQRQSEIEKEPSNSNSNHSGNMHPIISCDDSPRTEVHEIIDTPKPV